MKKTAKKSLAVPDKNADEIVGRTELALFADRGFAFTIDDADAADVCGHLKVLSASALALSRVIRIAEDSDELADDEAPSLLGKARDGVEFMLSVCAIFADTLARAENARHG